MANGLQALCNQKVFLENIFSFYSHCKQTQHVHINESECDDWHPWTWRGPVTDSQSHNTNKNTMEFTGTTFINMCVHKTVPHPQWPWRSGQVFLTGDTNMSVTHLACLFKLFWYPALIPAVGRSHIWWGVRGGGYIFKRGTTENNTFTSCRHKENAGYCPLLLYLRHNR